MKIAVPKERRDGETRVAATPDVVKKHIAAGHEVWVESGAGAHAAAPDAAYREAGATVSDGNDRLGEADLVMCVRPPDAGQLKAMRAGAALIGLLNPHVHKDLVEAYATAGVDAFAMELTPRITRAQSMDALSSQSNLAGYRAVIEAANAYGRVFPMMMTAAGTVAAAKCFVMGAGVAGLQAIATARRLGAIVSATDVRPAAKEQVASLGAKFIAVENDEFKEAETAGGYAKEMSDDYKRQQAELVAEHLKKQTIVVTTALIPGRPAPKLMTRAMVESMPEGGVVVDMAIEAGGNVEGAVLGEAVNVGGTTVIGYANLPGRMAADASALLAKNHANLLPLFGADDGALAANVEDEIVKGMMLTRGGKVVHAAFAKEPA